MRRHPSSPAAGRRGAALARGAGVLLVLGLALGVACDGDRDPP